jgi:hypothetical protein
LSCHLFLGSWFTSSLSSFGLPSAFCSPGSPHSLSCMGEAL